MRTYSIRLPVERNDQEVILLITGDVDYAPALTHLSPDNSHPNETEINITSIINADLPYLGEMKIALSEDELEAAEGKLLDAYLNDRVYYDEEEFDYFRGYH